MHVGRLQNKMMKWQDPSPESASVPTGVLRELQDEIALIGNLWLKATTGIENFCKFCCFN